MNVCFDLGHPGHVHFFRHAAGLLEARGHRIFHTCRDMAIVHRLLAAQGRTAVSMGAKRQGRLGLGVELAGHTARLAAFLVKNRIDVVASIGGTLCVMAARLTGRPCVVFTDTDTATVENRIVYPLADCLATPTGYPHDLGDKQRRYKGLHELAYVHPDLFTPDPAVAARYGLDPDEPYSVVRLSSWEAGHDLDMRRALPAEKLALVARLAERGRVVVVPEGEHPKELAEVAPPLTPALAPEDFHHLLAFSRFCLTEGATTASEASLLGIPGLYINPARPFYIGELAAYGLLALARPGEGDLAAALEAHLPLADDRAACRDTARRIVAERVNVAAFAADLVEEFGGR